MLTYAVEDSILTNQNIDDLFTKADNLETQAKQEEDIYQKLQLDDQFRNVKFHDSQATAIRQKIFYWMLWKGKDEDAVVTLKLIQVLVAQQG